MKKILLFLSLAFFLTAAVVTVTKVQSVYAAPTELSLMNDDGNHAVKALTDKDEKDKKKAGKDENCKKENCTKENCPEAKCAEKGAAAKQCEKGKTCCEKNKAACHNNKGDK